MYFQHGDLAPTRVHSAVSCDSMSILANPLQYHSPTHTVQILDIFTQK